MKSENMSRLRMRSASWLFSVQVLNLLVSFPISVLLARGLGASGKGTLTVVQLVATMSAALFNLGLGGMLTYYGARREAHSRDAIRLAAAASVGLAAILLLLAIPFGHWAAESLLHADSVGMVLIGILAVAPVLFSQLTTAYLIGRNHIRNASLVNVASITFQLLADLVLFALHLLTPLTAVLVWVTAMTGSAIAVLAQALVLHPEGTAEGVATLLRRGYRYGLATWASNTLATLALRQDVFLVAYFLNTRAVGIYSIAVTLAELTWYIPSALNGVLLPKVASEREGTIELTQRLTRIAWPITLTAAVLVAVVAFPLLPIVFGRAFSESFVPLVCLIPGIVASSIGSMPSAYVTGIGHPLDWTRASTANLMTNFLANLVLIPRIGIPGAALASSISYSVSTAVVTAYFLRRSDSRLRDLLVPRASDFADVFAAVRSVLLERVATPQTD